MTGRGGARFAGAVLAAAGLVGGLVSAAPALAAGSPGTITTVAGGPGRGNGTNVFQEPAALAAGPGGAVYVADERIVRELTTAKSSEGVAAGVLDSPIVPLFTGDGGPAVKAWLGDVTGLAVDAAGNVVIADNLDDRVRVVAASTGTFYGRAMTARHIYTVAGNGTAGYSGNGGPATSADVIPVALAVDPAGNLVIADGSDRVRVVAASTGTFYGQAMTAGDIYTIAGNGTKGYSGDGGPATSAKLGDPDGVAVGPAGNLVIADTGNERVRVVAAKTGTYYGQAMTAGDIYTIAGNGAKGYSGDGGPATSAELSVPHGVAVDTAGNLVIADTGNDRVRVVAAKTGTYYGQAMTAGDIYTIAGNGAKGYSGKGGPATSARLANPEDVAFDTAGNLVIADYGNDRVRVVAASTGTFYGQAMTAGDIYTVAGNGTSKSSGSGGLAVNAELAREPVLSVSDVAVDSGNYVVVQSNRAWFICETAGTYFGQAMTAGDIYAVAGNGNYGYSGNGGPATSAELDIPAGVTVDAAGNLVITDTGNFRVRVVAASTGTFYGQAMTAGDIYTVAGNGNYGYSGNGGPATSAELNFPENAAVDAAGNLVIADDDNNRVRVVAASTGTFYGQAMTAGDIYTVAGDGSNVYSGDGGPATEAGMSPGYVTVDAAGNLVISDTVNDRVRVVAASTGTFYGQAMTAGDIYTVAGNGTAGYSGNGGPATSAELDFPQGVAVDGSGNLIIADNGNNRVRVVAVTTGTFYAQAMTAGDIYTVAGNGTAGYSGDGGQATSAELDTPYGVAVDSSGNLLIADSQNGLVRLVSG
jgi:trimeric autotransporter adhesin